MFISKFTIFAKFKKFIKSKKRDKSIDTKKTIHIRRFDKSRVDFHALFSFFFFFVIQFSRRSTREKRNRLYKKKIFFEFKRQIQLKKNNEKKERFENVTQTMNDDDFVDLSQFSSQIRTSKNDMTEKIKNKIIHRDDKNLNDKHMIVKNSLKRSFEFVFEKLYFEENQCLYCNAYQYDNECYEIKRKSKY